MGGDGRKEGWVEREREGGVGGRREGRRVGGNEGGIGGELERGWSEVEYY